MIIALALSPLAQSSEEIDFALKILQKNIGSNNIDCHRGSLEEISESAKVYDIELCLFAKEKKVKITQYREKKIERVELLDTKNVISFESQKPLTQFEIKSFSLLNAYSELLWTLSDRSLLSSALLWSGFKWSLSHTNKVSEFDLRPISESMNIAYLKMSFEERFHHLEVFETKIIDSNTKFIFRVRKFQRWPKEKATQIFTLPSNEKKNNSP